MVKVEAFDGIGLRPYSVAHLNVIQAPTGDISVSWVRRTRIDGDNWQSAEVPLGEDSETYVVRVVQAAAIVREETSAFASWTYTHAAQVSDGIIGPCRIDVAQVSDRFGAGPFRSIDVLV